MKLLCAAATHPGYVRSNNEDAHLWLPENNTVVVADGMAGHRFGEMASAIAVKTVQEFYESAELERLLNAQFVKAKEADLLPRTQPFEQFKLRRALEEANLQIYETAQRNPQYETMGTTIVAVTLGERSLYVGHVGDSRVYRVRRGGLERLTDDHSLLNEYLRMGFLNAQEAAVFPLKNVIVRALGLQEKVAVDVAMRTARSGDILLLCSDGLTDLVPDEELVLAFDGEEDLEVLTHRLIEMALEAGGSDNVTVALARVEE